MMAFMISLPNRANSQTFFGVVHGLLMQQIRFKQLSFERDDGHCDLLGHLL